MSNFKYLIVLYKVLEKWDCDKSLRAAIEMAIGNRILVLDTSDPKYIFNNELCYCAEADNGVLMKVAGNNIRLEKASLLLGISAEGIVVVRGEDRKYNTYRFTDLQDRYMNPFKPQPEEAMVHAMSRSFDYETVNYLLEGFRKSVDI